MAIVHKAISAFNAIPIKISRILFTDITNNLKFIWKRGPRLPNLSWGKITAKLLYFRLYDKATVSKIVLTQEYMDHWNRTEGPEINSHIYAQIIFDKGGKTIK